MRCKFHQCGCIPSAARIVGDTKAKALGFLLAFKEDKQDAQRENIGFSKNFLLPFGKKQKFL